MRANAEVPPFEVLHRGNINAESQAGFRSHLERAYDFVTARFKDQKNRATCPIKIKFADLGGRTGFTPTPKTACDDVIVLDSSLENQWSASAAVVHELTHVIRHQSNPSEETWLDEGLAKELEYQFLKLWPQSLFQVPKTFMFKISTDSKSYAAGSTSYLNSFLLVHYLSTHLGDDLFLIRLMNSRLNGWSAIEEAARISVPQASIGIPASRLNRRDLFTHFAFALRFNDASLADCGLFQLDQNYSPVLNFTPTTANAASAIQALQPMSIQLVKPQTQVGALASSKLDQTTRGANIRVYSINGTQIERLDSAAKIPAQELLIIGLPD